MHAGLCRGAAEGPVRLDCGVPAAPLFVGHAVAGVDETGSTRTVRRGSLKAAAIGSTMEMR